MSKHVFKFQESHLQSGETVVEWCEGYTGEMMGSGDKKPHNGALVVTNVRVAFYRKGMFGEVLETIPLKSISSIERKSNLGHRTIRIHTSHDKLEFKMFDKAKEQLLISAIEQGRGATSAISSITTAVANSANQDPIEMLKKLADLKESGILSTSEYETKKAEIISRI